MYQSSSLFLFISVTYVLSHYKYGKYIDERIEAAERNKVKSATDRYNEEFWNRVLTNKRDNELFSYNKLGELLK